MPYPSRPILLMDELRYRAENRATKEFMSATTPITQRDVAQACGVHPSTICLALKNSPSIPLETRRRIQAVADELGYQPNVAARNLALLRTEKKAGGSLPIAWINQEPRRDHWRSDPVARVYHDGARRQAEALGFHLEDIWAQQPGMTVSRVIQIVRARGIEGVMFPVHQRFDFGFVSPAWNDFALVGFNDLRFGEWSDVFCPDHYQNTDLAIRQLRAMGCSRIGFVTTAQFEAATNGLAHSCFLRHQSEWLQTDRVPVCRAASAGAQATMVSEWIRDCRPDAVLCPDGSVQVETFPDVMWVHLQSGADHPSTGVDVCGGEIAAAAVECVVSKMRRFEKGLRASSRVHFIKGAWQAREAVRFERESVVA
jgi:LacI family transcriptional regulator